MVQKNKTRRRTGALQTMELLVVLPVVILIVSAAFEFGLMFLAQQRLQMATNVASRALAAGGDSQQLVRVAFATAIGDVPWAEASQVNIESAHEQAGLVRVTGSVPATRVAPDLLAAFGLGIGDRQLVATIVTTGG